MFNKISLISCVNGVECEIKSAAASFFKGFLALLFK